MRETLNPDPAMVAGHHQAATEEVPHPEATAEAAHHQEVTEDNYQILLRQ